MSLPEWFQGEIPTDLLRLARAHCKERVHRQILADWVERYGGEEGQLLCGFFRRDEVLRHDSSKWKTLSVLEARLVTPFSDLVLGIGDRLVLPLTETQSITMGWVPPGQSWLGGGGGTERSATAVALDSTLESYCRIYDAPSAVLVLGGDVSISHSALMASDAIWPDDCMLFGLMIACYLA